MPTGSPAPTTSTTSAASRALRVAAFLRGALRVVAERLVLLEAEAAVDHRPLGEPARDGPHRVERRRRQLRPPVRPRDARQHPQVRRDRRGEPRERHRGRGCPARRPAPLRRRPGASSSMPTTCATLPPYVSASTSSVRRPAAASSAATFTATVVRPGAPVGPHTATTRPRAGRRTRQLVGPRRLRRVVGRCAEDRERLPDDVARGRLVVRRDGHQVRPERREPLTEPRTRGVTDAHDADPGAVQQLDRLTVEQVEVTRDDGEVSEPCLRGRQQLREVGAPPRHTEAAAGSRPRPGR